MVKFDFEEISAQISDMNTNLEILNVLLENIKYQFDNIISDSVWSANSSSYFSSELKIFYDEIRNVRSISDNIKAYLAGVQENYQKMEDITIRSTVHNAGSSNAGGQGRKF